MSEHEHHDADSTLMDLIRSTIDARTPDLDDDLDVVARYAFELRHVDDLLADLVSDTLIDAPAAVRSQAGERVVTFSANELTIELTLGAIGEPVLGQLFPAEPATVQVHTPDDDMAVDTDDLGRFVVTTEAAWLRCSIARQGEPTVRTPWVIR